MLIIRNKQIPSCCVRCSVKNNQVLHIKKPNYIQNRIHVERQQCILKNQSLNQGAKKVIFKICHSGKLKLEYTSPNVISTSPQNILMSRIDFTVLDL